MFSNLDIFIQDASTKNFNHSH